LVVIVALPLIMAMTLAADRTTRASVSSAAGEGNGDSRFPSLSADGRYVAFEAEASNLVSGDTNDVVDVLVRDRSTGRTERASVATGGQQADGDSFEPSLSADGHYVAFYSYASNLVPSDTNGAFDVFVRDRTTGRTERASVATSGQQVDGARGRPSISADGRYVAFSSSAKNLVAGDTNGAGDVFVHDRRTGRTERVSVGSDGEQSNGESLLPSLSADGRYVAFYSVASNLVAGDTNGAGDVFVRDRSMGRTERASVGSDGRLAGSGRALSISANGRFVAFASETAALAPGDQDRLADLFVRDRTTGKTELVSVATGDPQAVRRNPDWPADDIETAFFPSISADGRLVVFYSEAPDLTPNDTNSVSDVFLRDRSTRTTTRMSVGAGGAEADSFSSVATISADGRIVAFGSDASNLVSGDTNSKADIFIYDRTVSADTPGTSDTHRPVGRRPVVMLGGFPGAFALILILVGFVGTIIYRGSALWATLSLPLLLLLTAIASRQDRIVLWLALIPFMIGVALIDKGLLRFLALACLIVLIPLAASLRAEFRNSAYPDLKLYGMIAAWILSGASLAEFLRESTPVIGRPQRFVSYLGVGFIGASLTSFVIDALFIRLRSHEWRLAGHPSIGADLALVLVGIILLSQLAGDYAGPNPWRVVRNFLSAFTILGALAALYDWLLENTLATVLWLVPRMEPPLLYAALISANMGMWAVVLTRVYEIAGANRFDY